MNNKTLKLLLSAGLIVGSTTMLTSPTETYALQKAPTETQGSVAINETNFPDQYFRNYIRDELDKDGDGYITQEQINNRLFINLLESPYNSVSDLTGIERFVNLEILTLSNTNISNIDLSFAPKLWQLDLRNTTNITNIDLSKNTAIELIDATDSKLTTLNLNGCTAVTHLTLDGSNINNLNIDDCTNLQELKLSNTKNLKSLNLANNINLYTLLLNNSGVENIDLSKNKSLYKLEAQNMKFGHLDLRKNIELYVLDLTGSSVEKLDLSKTELFSFKAPASVGDLNVQDTSIPSLDLTNIQGLKSVTANNLYYLNFNELNNVDLNVSSTIPLASNTNEIYLKAVARGIDLSKVSNVKNGTLDSNTGIITINSPKAKSISDVGEVSYDYNCGLLDGKPYILTVRFVQNTAPTIQAEDREVYLGDEFDAYEGLSVLDNESSNLLSKVMIDHDVDTSKLGEYTVTYRLRDGEFNAEKTIKVTVVKRPNTAPSINVDHFYLTVGDKFDPLKGVTATDVDDGDLTKEIEVTENTVDTSKAGTYEVSYKVVDHDSKFPLSHEISVQVFVTERPVIHASDITIHVGDKFDPLKGVTVTDEEQGDLTSRIEIVENTVDTSKVGTYTVTYQVTDDGKSTATKTINVHVVESENTTPQTSDMTNLIGLSGLALVSGMAISVISKKKKRNK